MAFVVEVSENSKCFVESFLGVEEIAFFQECQRNVVPDLPADDLLIETTHTQKYNDPDFSFTQATPTLH
jgi:Tat protein secretion system quality control protein TatD with DNase activity